MYYGAPELRHLINNSVFVSLSENLLEINMESISVEILNKIINNILIIKFDSIISEIHVMVDKTKRLT